MRYCKILLVALLLMWTGWLSADNLTVDNISMSPGETKMVGIILKNPAKQYVAFQFDIVLPTGVTIVNNEKGKPDITLNEERSYDHTLTVQDKGSGRYRLISYSLSNKVYSDTDGILVYMTIKVDNNCSEGNKSVNIKSQRFTDVGNDENKWDDMSFIVEVKKPDSGEQEDEPVADVDQLKVDDVFIRPGGTRQVAIQLINQERQYVGFQFELVLPAGISIVNENGKYLANVNSNRSEDHHLTVNSIGNNTYRFLAYSMPIVEFSGKEGALLYVTLQASDAIDDGELTGTIQSQRLTTPDAETAGGYKEMKWKDVSFMICVGSILGDANGDGDVNEKDVYAIASHIQGETPKIFDEKAADLNGDQKVNAADIVTLVNIIQAQ